VPLEHCLSITEAIPKLIFQRSIIVCPIHARYPKRVKDWADDDGSLEYQFGYSFGDTEAVFEWHGTRMEDFNLPSGTVSFKARVRDVFGGSTPWIGAGSVTVGVDQNNARRLLHEDVT